MSCRSTVPACPPERAILCNCPLRHWRPAGAMVVPVRQPRVTPGPGLSLDTGRPGEWPGRPVACQCLADLLGMLEGSLRRGRRRLRPEVAEQHDAHRRGDAGADVVLDPNQYGGAAQLAHHLGGDLRGAALGVAA